MIDASEIEKLAELARIRLSNEEKKKLPSEMDAILGYVADISSVVSVASHDEKDLSLTHNIMRDDTETHASGEFTESLLAEAPGREGNYVKVKKILESNQ